MKSWKTLSSKVVYENPWIVVHEDKVITPSSKEGLYGYIDSKSESVYVVPIDDEGNTYLTRQERYTLKRVTLECVAGRTDGDSIEAAAKRELLEETGLQAKSITIIGNIQVAKGISTFKSTVCIARGLALTDKPLDAEDGILGVEKIPLNQISDKVLAGEVDCSQSIASFYMTLAYLRKEESRYN